MDNNEEQITTHFNKTPLQSNAIVKYFSFKSRPDNVRKVLPKHQCKRPIKPKIS